MTSAPIQREDYCPTTHGPITPVLRRLQVVLLGVAAVFFGGCQPAPSPEGASDAVFDERITAEIEDASANGASPGQIALLKEAKKAGEVSIEMAREARRRYAECAAAQGVQVTFTEMTRPDGWVSTVTAVKENSAGDAEQAALACEREEALWVTMLYSTQPVADRATSDYLDSQAPVLRACLERGGFSPEPDATGMELAMLTTSPQDESMREAGIQCLLDLGINGF